MARFAQGRHSLAISDISGQAFPWIEMVTQWNGLFVHYSEFESKQPQLNPKPSAADPTALPTTRPQQPSPDSLRFLSFNAITTFAAGQDLVNVYEENHSRSQNDMVRFRGPPGIAGAFNNIAAIDGIPGSEFCQAVGFKIYIGYWTSVTTTLANSIDATQTTGINLVSSTGWATTGPRIPSITNPNGTPTNAAQIPSGSLSNPEIITYTGITNNELIGVTRGAFSSPISAVGAGTTARNVLDPYNYYNIVTTTAATTGQISGGGYNTSSGPVTLKAIGPQ